MQSAIPTRPIENDSQFALERIDIGNLIPARFSLVTENRSGGYGTVILRICPKPFGGVKPLFDT